MHRASKTTRVNPGLNAKLRSAMVPGPGGTPPAEGH